MAQSLNAGNGNAYWENRSGCYSGVIFCTHSTPGFHQSPALCRRTRGTYSLHLRVSLFISLYTNVLYIVTKNL